MSAFAHRYEIDTTRPTAKEVVRDVVVRAVLPAVVLWGVIVGFGMLVVGPLGDLSGEVAINRWFVEHRTPFWSDVSTVFSTMGSTGYVIAATVLTVAVLWWRSRQWWFALVPALAVSLQAIIFMGASLIVGRERPDVDHMDDSPPTSSYPSGHTGASSALWFTLAMLAQRIEHPVLRRVVTAVCVLVPFLVATARLYRGMHGLTDVLVAILNGAVCVVLAWGYLRRDTSAAVRS